MYLKWSVSSKVFNVVEWHRPQFTLSFKVHCCTKQLNVCVCLYPQQHSTNQNPSLSRNNFVANLMHGHGDSSWSRSSLPEITEQRIFHILFYYEQIRLNGIINCIYPSWLNFKEYYFCILIAKSNIDYKDMNFIHLMLSQYFTIFFQFKTSNSLSQLTQECYCDF